MLLLADLVGLVAAFVTVELTLGLGRPLEGGAGVEGEIALFLASLPFWLILTQLYGLYDHDEERADHSTVDDFKGVLHVVTFGAWFFIAAAWVTRLAYPDLEKLLLFWALALALVTFARATARLIARRQVVYLQNTLIVGAGDVGQLVARKLLQHPEYGLNLVGFVDSTPKERRDDLGHLTLLGAPDELPEIIRLLDVERVIIAFSSESHDQTLDLIRSLQEQTVQVDIVPRLFEILSPSVGVHTVEGIPLLGLPALRLSQASRAIKRGLDIALSLLGLVVLAPVGALIALLIKLDSRGPVFFRQERMGAGSRTFRIYKYRTMVEGADERKADLVHLNLHVGGDARMFKVADDPRVTGIGRFLRRYSLDELPQLLNVLRGQMSLVGPSR